MDLDKLKAEFPNADIEWRVQRSGIKDGPWAIVVPYITNRAIMDRLDAVCGAARWYNMFDNAPGGEGGVLCGISIEVEPEQWVTKWDGAERTAIESVKGGLSAAMKRAAVQWGIGRYLYALDGPFYAKFDRTGKNSDKIEGTYYRWNPPQLTEKAADHPDHGSKGEDPATAQYEALRATNIKVIDDAIINKLIPADERPEYVRKLDEDYLQTLAGMQSAYKRLNALVKGLRAKQPAQPLKTAGQKFAEQAQAAVGDDAGADAAFGVPVKRELF